MKEFKVQQTFPVHQLQDPTKLHTSPAANPSSSSSISPSARKHDLALKIRCRSAHTVQYYRFFIFLSSYHTINRFGGASSQKKVAHLIFNSLNYNLLFRPLSLSHLRKSRRLLEDNYIEFIKCEFSTCPKHSSNTASSPLHQAIS